MDTEAKRGALERAYRAAVEDDRPQLLELLAWSFRIGRDDAERWISRAGLDSVRLVTVEGRMVACLIMKSVGIFIGGHSVSSAGIAAVAVAPDLRGRGIGRYLLERCLQELTDNGIATAVLYPSVRAVYRRLGFGVAGVRYTYHVNLRHIPRTDAALRARPVQPADRPSVRALYSAAAAACSGVLDRDDYYWGRVTSRPKKQVRGFVFEDETIEGYVYLHGAGSNDPFRYDLRITDYGFSTSRGLAALCAFLASHGSLGDGVVWDGGPADPLLHTLDTAHYTTRQVPTHWMLRVLDVERALAGRGYPAAAGGRVELQLRDPLLAANDGRFVLALDAGRMTVSPGGSGAFALHVEDLASLLTGHVTPAALVRMGRLTAPGDQLALAAQWFAGPCPWMREAF